MENAPRKIEGGGFAYWKEEIEKAGYLNQLKPFNDLLTGKEAPQGYGEPVLTDVVLDGKTCDIYHTDTKSTDTAHRIFIRIKE